MSGYDTRWQGFPTYNSPHKGGRVTSAADQRLWACAWCGNVAPWGPTWSWYGSFADLDEYPERLPTACCDEHMRELAKLNNWMPPPRAKKGSTP